MTLHPTRRGLLGQLSAAALLAALPLPGFALTTDQASALVGTLVADINQVINSGRSEAQMFPEFERIFQRYADVPTIARSTLGPDARRASAAQLQAFTTAFRSYISRKYGKRFREFIGGAIEVKSARAVKSFHEVNCIVRLTGEAPFAIIFLVSDQGGSDKFFDMLIEGISLLKSERTEIGAMIDRRGGDLDAMIRDLARAG